MLTRKQYELLLFIHQEIKENGIPPSFDEMKEALDLRSKSGIHRLISALEERGFIRRLPHRARALEILRMPEGMDPRIPERNGNGRGFEPNVIEGGGGKGASMEVDVVQIALVGRIAAGTPIEALQEDNNYIDIPAGLVGTGDHFALEVKGDSMIDAGIFDGDTVIIQQKDTATNGEIVVALVDDTEATLKRLRRRGESIALEPANSDYETRIFRQDQVKVQGRLVSLIRRY